jgi:tetratricopeptide (TPR) repeat protein
VVRRGWIVAGVLVALMVSNPATAQQADSPSDIPHAKAWQALKERRYGVAFDLFDAASASTPDDASLQFGAGVAQLMRGRNPEASIRFEAALALDPGLADASILLGQARYRQGDVAGAADVYAGALAHAPAHPDLLEPLARWRQELSADQALLTLDGTQFTVRFHAGDHDLAADVLRVAEAAHARIGGILSAFAMRRIAVVLYTRQEFAAVTQLPDWAAGLYDGRIKLPLGGRTGVSMDELARLLDHEVVHAIVAATAGPTVPAWLNEGLATALEPGGVAWAESFDAPPAARPFPTVARGFRALMPPEARLAYAQSTRVVKQLLDRHGPDRVGALLRAMGDGLPLASAFQAAFGEAFDDIDTPAAGR